MPRVPTQRARPARQARQARHWRLAVGRGERGRLCEREGARLLLFLQKRRWEATGDGLSGPAPGRGVGRSCQRRLVWEGALPIGEEQQRQPQAILQSAGGPLEANCWLECPCRFASLPRRARWARGRGRCTPQTGSGWRACSTGPLIAGMTVQSCVLYCTV
jgi:hypothetical protein